jgi:hypothetical protein
MKIFNFDRIKKMLLYFGMEVASLYSRFQTSAQKNQRGGGGGDSVLFVGKRAEDSGMNGAVTGK